MNKVIIVLAGLPGAGKSTAGKLLAKRLGISFIETDQIWRSKFRNPQYTEDESKIVFESVMQALQSTIDSGKSVIVEGVFASFERIKKIQKTAKSSNSSTIIVRFICDLALIDERLRNRTEIDGSRIPNELIESLSKRFKSWPENNPYIHQTDTGALGLPLTLQALEEFFYSHTGQRDSDFSEAELPISAFRVD